MARAKAVSPLPLMELTFSFTAFKTLAAAHELGLFKLLSGTRGMNSQELSKALGINERPAEMLLTACAALGLLEKRSARFRNSTMAEEFLVPNKRYYFGGFIEMFDKRLYAGWDKLAEALRTDRPTTWDPSQQKSLFEAADPLMMEHFWAAMHSVSTSTARALGEAVDFGSFKQLLDVGGGSGAFDIELCRRYRRLRATVYDLPHVTRVSFSKISEAGLADRIQTAPGDFFADSIYPQGHDAVLLSLIMHDWSEEEDREILQKCFDALPSGGTLIICELLVNNEKTGPVPAALMSLNMLIETEGGRNYTAAEYSSWLADIGFHKIRTVRFKGPGADGAVIGRKP